MTPDPADALVPWAPDASRAPTPDDALEPEGYVVEADDGSRLHFLDWGGPRGGPAGDTTPGEPAPPAVLLLPGLLQPASTWAPVARRLAGVRRTVAADLRGQGLSDAPFEGYDLETLAADAIAVVEGSGALAAGAGRVVVTGHGFGGMLAVVAAGALGERCAGVVLVDGGWERLEVTTDVDVEEFLRGLEEPPEVLRTMDAYLADRRAFDPGSWDRDQERAALDAVVETAAGHVVRAVRPHVVEALVRVMFEWDPAEDLASVASPVTALVALGAGEAEVRVAELRRTARARVAAGGSPIRVATLPSVAHNLMRYRPDAVTAAILEAAG